MLIHVFFIVLLMLCGRPDIFTASKFQCSGCHWTILLGQSTIIFYTCLVALADSRYNVFVVGGAKHVWLRWQAIGSTASRRKLHFMREDVNIVSIASRRKASARFIVTEIVCIASRRTVSSHGMRNALWHLLESYLGVGSYLPVTHVTISFVSNDVIVPSGVLVGYAARVAEPYSNATATAGDPGRIWRLLDGC